MSDLSLDHRIADAFTAQLSSGAISALLDEADQAAATARETNSKAKAIALDPATRPEDVAKARKEMEDCQFTSDRLTNTAVQLNELLATAKQREAKEAAKAEYKQARIERDQIAAELKSAYPELASRLVDLLQRLAASDERIANVNRLQAGPWLQPAEALARDVPATWSVTPDPTFPPLTAALRLPSFERTRGGYAWPKPSRYPS